MLPAGPSFMQGVFLAEHARLGAGKLAKDPGEVALVVKAQVQCEGAEWKFRVGQQPGIQTEISP